MKISLIVARTRNGVIGQNNQIPWHLPRDLAWFRQNTLKKPVIMGRKTFESIGRLLPNRLNIILSRKPYCVEGAAYAPNLADALAQAKATGAEEAMIIGGGELFKEALPLADCLYVTEIQADLAGDTFFEFDAEQWEITQSECYEADENNAYGCVFNVLARRGAE